MILLLETCAPVTRKNINLIPNRSTDVHSGGVGNQIRMRSEPGVQLQLAANRHLGSRVRVRWENFYSFPVADLRAT